MKITKLLNKKVVKTIGSIGATIILKNIISKELNNSTNLIKKSLLIISEYVLSDMLITNITKDINDVLKSNRNKNTSYNER